MNTATSNLATAWTNRAQEAWAELQQMNKAPALFKPSRVQEIVQQYQRAVLQAAYWGRQATR